MTDPSPVAPPSPRVNHDRLYTALLVVFILASLMAIWLYAAVLSLPPGTRAPSPTRAPDWLVRVSLWVSSVYLLMMIPVLGLRLTRSIAARRATRALNWALLPAVPFGTALGIYGLRKVNGVRAATPDNRC